MSKSLRVFWLCLATLSLVAAACATDTATVELGSQSTGSQSQAEPTAQPPEPAADEPTALPLEDPTAEPTPEPTSQPAEDPTSVPAAEPTAEPTVEPTAEPTAAPTPSIDVGDVDPQAARIFGQATFASGLTPEQTVCAVTQLGEDSGLFTRVLATDDFDNLSLQDQADLALVAFDCAPEALAEEFSGALNSGDAAIPAEVGECLITAMSPGAPNRELVVLGFTALGQDIPVPIEAEDAVVDAMVLCLPGTVFASAISDSVLENPEFADALDFDCLAGALNGETMRPIWRAVVRSPDVNFDALPPETTGPMLQAIFGCVSFGRILSSQSGFPLSDATIACIDEGLVDLDINALIENNEGAELLGLTLLSCVTPEELEGLG